MSRLPFQKLQVWQKGMQLAKKTYEVSKKLPQDELYGLTSQIRRASVSVPSNIAEGSQRTTDRDFANFLSVSKGSLAELQTQILLISELGYISTQENELLQTDINELQKMLGALHVKLTATR
jgi:four helix bundle protein